MSRVSRDIAPRTEERTIAPSSPIPFPAIVRTHPPNLVSVFVSGRHQTSHTRAPYRTHPGCGAAALLATCAQVPGSLRAEVCFLPKRRVTKQRAHERAETAHCQTPPGRGHCRVPARFNSRSDALKRRSGEHNPVIAAAPMQLPSSVSRQWTTGRVRRPIAQGMLFREQLDTRRKHTSDIQRRQCRAASKQSFPRPMWSCKAPDARCSPPDECQGRETSTREQGHTPHKVRSLTGQPQRLQRCQRYACGCEGGCIRLGQWVSFQTQR